MSNVVWDAELGWHDGVPARVTLEDGRIKSAPLGGYTTAHLGAIKRHPGIAGQVAYSVEVTYPGEDVQRVIFVGSVYGGPVLMHTPRAEMYVTDPGRFGERVSTDWVRRFFE